ncbi:g6950 [Coccomyxa viridis]|uniref:G6950 protein n=1 Tax=Coccomyxa viridis TaxID=1274662 RepID=A0ABP1FZ44_9CHLO
MLDHIMIKVKDWKRAKAYYETTLKHLDYELFWDSDNAGGFQGSDAPHGRIYIRQDENPGRIHFAIAAPSADAVKAYYAAALANGGTDNGAPGHRAHYGPEGVGTFVIDLDNNNIEVVSH